MFVAGLVSEGPPVVFYSPSRSAVAAAVGDTARTALQPEPLGTADAVRAALDVLPERAAELVVLSGDTPLLEVRTVRALLELRRAEVAVMALATIAPADPAGYGRVVRDAGGHVSRIVEEKDASAAERDIGEVNGGLYAFDAGWLRARLAEVAPSTATGELYLTELVALARRDAAAVVAHPVADARELAGVNDRLQLSVIEAELRRRLLERHMRAGVTMEDPGSVYLDASVELAPDVVLEPDVYLRGATRVGSGTVVGSGSQLLDTVVGERCTIRASVLESSVVEDDVRIGPFAHLRPGSSIGRGGHIGNYAEVKNSRLEPGVQQHHMSYLGDAHVGERTNIGAGTITANFDGRRKLPTTIGPDAFIGVDTMLVAPVEVGPGAKTGAGAVVTRNVPAGKLAVGVPARIREPRAHPGDSSAERPHPVHGAGPDTGDPHAADEAAREDG